MMISPSITLNTNSNEFITSMFLPFCFPISAPITEKLQTMINNSKQKLSNITNNNKSAAKTAEINMYTGNS